MSIHTAIQWCDSTVNPVMGCDGCELWPARFAIVDSVADAALQLSPTESTSLPIRVKVFLEGRTSSDIYHEREAIASTIVDWWPSLSKAKRKSAEKAIAQAIAKEFKCYAGVLHLWRGANDSKPEKRPNPGYARKFESPTLYPGRMSQAATWNDLRGTYRADKPWFGEMCRSIFISDMGDSLSAAVRFEYLRKEIIENVASIAGRRHVWLWLTKRPQRMAKFCDWLLSQGVPWPENLVAMTSVTSSRTMGRVAQLKKVKSRFRGLSVEPLWEEVSLDLTGIDWVIVGGESAIRPVDAKPFDIEWARDLREQCGKAGAAFFVKQLGSRPLENGMPIKLKDRHGGDWSEWPEDLRIREMPVAESLVEPAAAPVHD